MKADETAHTVVRIFEITMPHARGLIYRTYLRSEPKPAALEKSKRLT